MNKREKLEPRVRQLLGQSLRPPQLELDELDWKLDLSPNKVRLCEHISAFSNLEGGGFLVFGISPKGLIVGVDTESAKYIVSKMTNICRGGIDPANNFEYFPMDYEDKNLLVVFIHESKKKPVRVKAGATYDCFTRSGGETRIMSKEEFIEAVKRSDHESFEEGIAKQDVLIEEVKELLDFETFFKLVLKREAANDDDIVTNLLAAGIITDDSSNWSITNLGAISLARDLTRFPRIFPKKIRFAQYSGKDKTQLASIQEGSKGYMVGFEGIVQYIIDKLPVNTELRKALRVDVKGLPEGAVREAVANALVHQDFYVKGTSPVIELFSDRLEIVNPGKPLVNTLRFIDTPSKSRNEKLSNLLMQAGICELHGTGIDEIVKLCEVHQLPAPLFIAGEGYTTVVLYMNRPMEDMSKQDKIRACYQHTALNFVSHNKTTNSSIRERFGISESNHPIANRIINDTLKEGLVKVENPNNHSRRYTAYIPFWA